MLRLFWCHLGLLFGSFAIPVGVQAQNSGFTLERRLSAPEAHQAVAVDAEHVYAITNQAIGKYDKTTGERVGRWAGAEDGPIIHLNSGVVRGDTLFSAHSNYPGVPMTSSIEMWDVTSMDHIGSHPLGIYQGSATWIDRRGGDWWVAFAHYGQEEGGEGPSGGVPGKGPEWTSLVRFSPDWQRRTAWTFPAEVIDRMRPYSTSGGAWGPDGRLYVQGTTGPRCTCSPCPPPALRCNSKPCCRFPGKGKASPGTRLTQIGCTASAGTPMRSSSRRGLSSEYPAERSMSTT